MNIEAQVYEAPRREKEPCVRNGSRNITEDLVQQEKNTMQKIQAQFNPTTQG